MSLPDRTRAWLVGVSRAIGGAALGGFVAILLVQLCAFALPGSWFLRSESPVDVADTLVGEPVPFKWCRQPVFGPLAAVAVRTFYKSGEGGRFAPAEDYQFKLNVEPTRDDCQELVLPTNRQPQEAGTYYFVTDVTWTELGYQKRIRYESNPYTLGATPESLRERIRELEDQVRRLRERLASASTGATVDEQVAAVEVGTPAPLARTEQPTTSAPPEQGPSEPKPATSPPLPSEPVDGPSLLERLPIVGPLLGGLGL